MSGKRAGHGEKQSSRRERAIAALLVSDSQEKAARMAGISHVTMRAWMKEPAFAAELKAARKRSFERALNHLQGIAGEAVKRLRLALKSSRDADAIRAAVAVLDLAFKANETGDLAEQMAAIRRQLEGEP